MKIPKQFQLMGQTIKVTMDGELHDRTNNTGESHYRYNEIKLQSHVNGKPRTDEQIGETFCHELMHFILDILNENKLCSNEKFVDTVAGLLFQALETMK